MFFHRVEFAGLEADAALDAAGLVDPVPHLAFAADAVDRTAVETESAADAAVGDFVPDQLRADSRRTAGFLHMGEVLVLEVRQRRQHRIRRGLAEPAERGVLDRRRQGFQPVDHVKRGAPFGDLVEHLVHAAVADAAGSAFAAGFVEGEFEEELRDVDHTVVLVHHDHAAGAHH